MMFFKTNIVALSMTLSFLNISDSYADDLCYDRRRFISRNCNCSWYQQRNCKHRYYNGEGKSYLHEQLMLCEKCCCIDMNTLTSTAPSRATLSVKDKLTNPRNTTNMPSPPPTTTIEPTKISVQTANPSTTAFPTRAPSITAAPTKISLKMPPWNATSQPTSISVNENAPIGTDVTTTAQPTTISVKEQAPVTSEISVSNIPIGTAITTTPSVHNVGVSKVEVEYVRSKPKPKPKPKPKYKTSKHQSKSKHKSQPKEKTKKKVVVVVKTVKVTQVSVQQVTPTPMPIAATTVTAAETSHVEHVSPYERALALALTTVLSLATAFFIYKWNRQRKVNRKLRRRVAPVDDEDYQQDDSIDSDNAVAAYHRDIT